MSSQSFFSTSGVSVKVANLRKKYQTAAEEIEALSGVDWAVEEGVAAAIIGPSESIPFENSQLLLGTWQSIMLCEFDGPRYSRKVIITLFTG